MDKTDHSRATYQNTIHDISTRNVSVTYAAEERSRRGLGVDPLVDPRLPNGIRESRSLLVPVGDGTFVLKYGVALPNVTIVDGTGSMRTNIEIAFGGIPTTQDFLVQGGNPIFAGYHAQFANCVVQDTGDDHPFMFTQFETDNRIEAQMGMLVPDHGGADRGAEYQIALYYLGYRTELDITKYNLKGYCSIVADERIYNPLSKSEILRLTGGSVAELPSLAEVVARVLEKYHLFYLQIRRDSTANAEWVEMIGPKRVIYLPSAELFPHVQAVAYGLTEGVLSLSNSADFLLEYGRVSIFDRDGKLTGEDRAIDKTEAEAVVRAVQHIEVGAQAKLPNFGKLPSKGSIFASRTDLYPMEGVAATTPTNPGGQIDWNL